jgi:ubiquinone/menaquinone biosynthesis C-methylase UbiE
MAEQMVFPAVLDACCGPRMMWFDSKDRRALFIDKRQEIHALDIGTPGTVGRQPAVIAPDVVADFTAMPFRDESFYVVAFDPPHIERQEARGILTRKYGVLPNDWRGTLRAGFAECFRVLKPHGVLVFKWAESDYPISEVLSLTPAKPLFGHRH